jgi:AcrR family transcriptional regulator
MPPAAERGQRNSSSVVQPRLRYPEAGLGPRAERTIGRILDATRQIFLVKGYAGTTIDEIARVAGVSRPTVYTYFPSKRDILLTIGADSLRGASQVIESLGKLDRRSGVDEIAGWVEAYFAHLDQYGSFAFAWIQASHEDEELRRAGTMGHLELCRRLGVAVAGVGGRDEGDPTTLGLAIDSLMEHSWAFLGLYEGSIDRANLTRTIAGIVASTAEQGPNRPSRLRGSPVR